MRVGLQMLSWRRKKERFWKGTNHIGTAPATHEKVAVILCNHWFLHSHTVIVREVERD